MALLLSGGTKLLYSIGLNAIAAAFNIRTFKGSRYLVIDFSHPWLKSHAYPKSACDVFGFA